MRLPLIGLFLLPSLLVGTSAADTLFLRAGKTLKITSLSCDARLCRATLEGGEVEIEATLVVRVEPDEEVDVESPSISSVLADPPRAAADLRTIDQMVADAARKYALPRSLVRAVARAESSLNPSAVSPKGAQGVMQLMPGTARGLGVRDAFDPAENIDAGARLLRQLLEKYQGRVAEALSAYNAGEGAVARHKGVPPYRETRGYIRKVVKDFEKAERPVSQEPAKKK